jgi:hypothetical protein
VIQFGGEIFGDLFIHVLSESSRARNVTITLLGYILLGAAIGGLTVVIIPTHVIANEDLRVANLILTPLLVAGAMASAGAIRRRRGKRVVRMERFFYAYASAVSIALVRFFFAD